MAENQNRNNSKITTIKLSGDTKERLEKLREHRRESYEDILKKMLGILNLTRQEPEKAKAILNRIHKAPEPSIKYTKVYSREKQEKPKVQNKTPR